MASSKRTEHEYVVHGSEKGKLFRVAHDFDESTPEKVLDLCLIMDCTSSMSSWIDHCKTTLLEVVDDTVEEDEGSFVRVSFVGYRDFGDGANLYSIMDFSYDTEAVKSFISEARAMGGADIPEDVQGGLKRALELSWLPNSIKVAYFCADAPAHGKQYHTFNDDYPNGSKHGHVLEDLVKSFSDREILLSCFKLNDKTEQMFGIMETAYESGITEDGFEFIDIRGQIEQAAPMRSMAAPMRRSSPPAMRSVCLDDDEEDGGEMLVASAAPEMKMAARSIAEPKSSGREVYASSMKQNLRKQKCKQRKKRGW